MTDRGLARLAGVLFITATVADIVSVTVRPSLTGPTALTAVAAGADRVTLSALLLALAAFACAGIAVAMYPVLRRSSAGLALGAVVFRAIEAGGLLLATACLLALLAIGREGLAPGATAQLDVAGTLLVTLKEQIANLAVLAFCVGAMHYYVLFFRARLVPRWLSAWGIVAIVMLVTAVVLALVTGRPVSSFLLLAFPILVQEMVLAAWLITKGFRPAPIARVADGRAPTAAAAPAASLPAATS